MPDNYGADAVTSTLAAGDKAPDFALVDTTGELVALRDFAGSRVVVYFYPKAMTPGCTTEACDFRDNMATLGEAGVTVLGISRDEPQKLAEFAAQEALGFRLLSDPERVAHMSYGVLGTKVVDGVAVERVLRSTFVVGPGGDIERALYDVQAAGHVAELISGLTPR